MAVTIELWYSQPAQVRFEFAASMGPQLYRCGNEPTLTRRSNGVKSFNEAATLSLRKFELSFKAGRLSSRFNGAATLSLRKCGLANVNVDAIK